MSQASAAGRQPAGGVPPALGVLLVLLAATGFGILPLLSRTAYASGLSPEVATFYRYGIPLVFFLPFLPRLFRTPRTLAITVATGLFLGFGVLGYFRALRDMPVAIAALIFFTFPLFAVVLGFLLFRLKPDRRALAGAGLVLIACTLFLDPTDLAARPQAVLHAFLAPIAYATVILVAAHVLAGTDRILVLAGIYAGTAVSSTLPLVLSAGGQLLPDSASGALAAIGMITIGGVLPQVALIFGAPAVGPARTAILAAFELVVALTCGWTVLGEPVLSFEVVSALLILAAIVLAALARPARVESPAG